MQPGSVSQGIFFQVPGTKKQTVSGNQIKLEEMTAKYFDGFGQPVRTAEIRSKFYRHLLKQYKKKILKLQEGWYEDFVTNVVKYIKFSEPSVVSDNQEATTPIAFLATGLPKDENKIVLDKICSRVRDLTPHVTTLSSRTCKDVKNAFQIMCKQLIQTTFDSLPNGDLDLSDTEDGLNVTRRERSKLKFISAHDLQHWYRGSPQKPVVIFIEDIDFFPLPIAQNLLMAFSCLKLPLIFVVGVTSCSQNFDSYVPKRCPTTFLYRTFHPIGPQERLTDFMNTIVLDPNSLLQLSGPIVRYITNIFLHHEFSCTRLEQMIKLCMLEHFRKPHSIFCAKNTHVSEGLVDLADDIQEILKENFDIYLKRRSSMKMKITTASPRKVTLPQQTLIVDDVKSRIMTFHNRKLEWYAYLKFFHSIIQNIPGCPFGDQVTDLYASCWNGDLFKNSEEYDDQRSPLDVIIGLFHIMSRPQLETQLTKGVEELENFHSTYDCTETDTIDLLVQLKSFMQSLEKADEEDRQLQEEQRQAEEEKRKSPRKKFKNQAEFLQKMKERATGADLKFSVYPSLRDKIVKWLKDKTKSFLTPLSEQTLSKAFIFDDIQFIQETFTPNSQKRIHAALMEPSKFFTTDENEDTIIHQNGFVGELDKSDVSIVYNLLLEQDMQNINVNIIFESFKTFIEVVPNPPKKRRSVVPKTQQQGDSSLNQSYLIRFRQAIGELQHMGFLKRSKLKVDEVSKQTFGF